MLKVLDLSDKDKEELNDWCGNNGAFNPVPAADTWRVYIADLHLDIEDEVNKALTGDIFEAVYIKGIDIPCFLEDTPNKTKFRNSTLPLPTDMMHYIVCRGLGSAPICYPEEHAGNAIHNISKVEGHAGEFSSSGDSDFPYHVEVPQDSFNPNWISLCCLRGDPKVDTSYIVTRDLFKGMNDELLSYCYKPCMELKVAPSFDNVGVSMTVPLIKKGMRNIIFDSVEMYPIKGDWKSMSIYQHIMINIQKAKATVATLEAGDMLIINNRQVLHSRKAGGGISSERWLTRMYHR